MTLNILPEKYGNLVIIIIHYTDTIEKNPCMLQIFEKGWTSNQKKNPVLEKCGSTTTESQLKELILQWGGVCIALCCFGEYGLIHLELPPWKWDSCYQGSWEKILHTRKITTLLRRKMLHRMGKDTLQNQSLDRSLLLLFLLITILLYSGLMWDLM